MKICLINNLFKPYERGGAEKVVEFIYENLKVRGYDVFLIATRPYLGKGENENESAYYLRSCFYNIAKMPLVLRFFWHIWNLVDFVTLIKVRRILEKEKPDVVMTHNLSGLSFLIPRLIKKMGIRHIHTVHDIQLMHPSGLMYSGKEKIIDSLFAKIYQAICRALFKTTSSVISPSNWLMEKYFSKNFFLESNKFVLPNPMPRAVKEFERINSSNKFTFLYVGQIEDHKGVLFLAKTFVNFWFSFWRGNGEDKTKVEIELLIVGAGEKLGELGKIVYGDEKIKVLGGRTNVEVKELMKSVDCLIVPSLCYENSPLVIYEAVNCGLPVIASRIGGITELLHDTGGILFEPGSEKDLVKKIKYLLEHREALEAVSARERLFNPKDYIDNLLSVL